MHSDNIDVETNPHRNLADPTSIISTDDVNQSSIIVSPIPEPIPLISNTQSKPAWYSQITSIDWNKLLAGLVFTKRTQNSIDDNICSKPDQWESPHKTTARFMSCDQVMTNVVKRITNSDDWKVKVATWKSSNVEPNDQRTERFIAIFKDTQIIVGMYVEEYGENFRDKSRAQYAYIQYFEKAPDFNLRILPIVPRTVRTTPTVPETLLIAYSFWWFHMTQGHGKLQLWVDPPVAEPTFMFKERPVQIPMDRADLVNWYKTTFKSIGMNSRSYKWSAPSIPDFHFPQFGPQNNDFGQKTNDDRTTESTLQDQLEQLDAHIKEVEKAINDVCSKQSLIFDFQNSIFKNVRTLAKLKDIEEPQMVDISFNDCSQIADSKELQQHYIKNDSNLSFATEEDSKMASKIILNRLAPFNPNSSIKRQKTN